MKRHLIAVLSALFFCSSLADAHAAAPSNSWSKEEMNPLPDTAGANDKTIDNINCGSGCNFNLHYFIGGRKVRDKKKKNILFIAGGPGQIMKRATDGERRFLEFLEDEYNVFYFDIRGAGFSSIHGSNEFDTALRAENVIEDLERIRKAELTDPATKKVGAWHAVYGHSHGTVVAQLYAKSSPRGSPRLDKLILSAPLSRRKDFEQDRIQMLVENLKSIFENYRKQTPGRDCPAGVPPRPLTASGTDNFCFLFTGNDGMAETLVSKFKRKLTELSETFGSVAFVAEYFDEIKNEEPNLVEFPSKFPYPKSFYLALKRLSLFGATEPKPLEAVNFVREARVNSAFLLGYYLAFDEEKHFDPGDDLHPATLACRRDAPFLKGVTNRARDEGWREAYCDRYLSALAMLVNLENSLADSERANIVFGLNDGINSFILKILNVTPTPNGCIHSKELNAFANDARTAEHKTARALLKRVGIDLRTLMCLWNPQNHVHSIPTLILKGGADPITSGGQAEHLFHCGLTGERVLLNFPGVGHFMELPRIGTTGAKTDDKKPLTTFVDIFLKKSFAEFSADRSVRDLKEKLSATMNTATGQGSAGNCPN